MPWVTRLETAPCWQGWAAAANRDGGVSFFPRGGGGRMEMQVVAKLSCKRAWLRSHSECVLRTVDRQGGLKALVGILGKPIQ